MSPATAQRGWLADQLPRPLAEDHFTRQFVAIFEDLAGGIRDRVSGFEHALDPSLGPPAFVRWVGAWLGLALDPSLPEERQRGLVRAAGRLFALRGTPTGLQGLLEAFTEGTVKIEDGGGVFSESAAPPNRNHVVIDITGSGGMSEEHISELVRQELPASASFELRVREGRGGSRRKKARGAPPAPDMPGAGAVTPPPPGGSTPPAPGFAAPPPPPPAPPPPS